MVCSNVSDRGGRRCPATRFPSHFLSTHHIAKQIQTEELDPNPSSSGFIHSDRLLCNGEREQWFLISLNQTPPTNLSLNLTTELLCNGEREQCFLISLNQTSPTNLFLNLTTEHLHQSNDIFGQTSEQHFDGTSNDSRSGPPAIQKNLVPPASLDTVFSASRRHGASVTELGQTPLEEMLSFNSYWAWPINKGNMLSFVGSIGSWAFWGPYLVCPNSLTMLVHHPSDNLKCRHHLRSVPPSSLVSTKNTSIRARDSTKQDASLLLSRSSPSPILTTPMPQHPAVPLLPSTSLSKSRFTLFNILSRSLPEIWCSIKNGRRRHSILVSTSSVETCIHHWQNLINRVDGLSPNATLSVASSMEKIIKSSYASFARAIYDHKLIRNFKCEFLKVSKDFPTFANSLKMCILDYSLSLYLFFSCIGFTFSLYELLSLEDLDE